MDSYIDFAKEDLISARIQFRSVLEGYYNNFNRVGVDSQQCCEKAMKAVIEELCKEDDTLGNLLKTHNLTNLFKATKSIINYEVRPSDLGWLSGLYFNCRYPGEEVEHLDEDEGKLALNLAEEVYRSCNAYLCNDNKETNLFKK